MKNPCQMCIERDICQGKFHCKKRIAFLRWKEKADQIRKHTKEIMERSRRNGGAARDDGD